MYAALRWIAAGAAAGWWRRGARSCSASISPPGCGRWGVRSARARSPSRSSAAAWPSCHGRSRSATAGSWSGCGRAWTGSSTCPSRRAGTAVSTAGRSSRRSVPASGRCPAATRWSRRTCWTPGSRRPRRSSRSSRRIRGGAARTSPPTGAEGLLAEIAAARRLPGESPVVEAGSPDLIFRAFGRWLTPGSRVLLLDPGYGEYAHVTERVIGCRVDRLRLRREDGWLLDPARLAAATGGGRYDLVVVVNPNNPTGRHVPADALRAVIEASPARTRWCIDEAYLGYVDPPDSLASLASADARVVVCTSLSKMYALSGMRAAYLVACPETAGERARRGPVWSGVLAGLVPSGALGLVLFVAVSVADIVAYAAGRRLGGPRLFPLSPAKRWSGTLAGAAAGLLTLAALSCLTWQTAVPVALGGPLGDLLESMVKRGARTKDTGRWLPGSGGLLDRIDSLLVALAVLLVLQWARDRPGPAAGDVVDAVLFAVRVGGFRKEGCAGPR
ncbi:MULTISPECIES: aminotransferase class I/II-fold pyridoxal phosphate-dependent enzyme [unclassified Streptomyces]|uniref:aminotransferase class I/II-fold pyridoxal phosphate-dependent enzyme n=1 Tax=unclassified Streptomyces TaxID=2593676 RepID=UPI001F481710|nr:MULTISPECIES: aminotransferase class I/II-fold pyridoxal phosphate-dependent enzyme [unclassified Streptomyces]